MFLCRSSWTASLPVRKGTKNETAFPIAIGFVAILLAAGCGSKPASVEAVSPDAAKPVAVTTAVAISREVPADFEETGTFVADESSDIAPPVAGRVISTPVDVGARRQTGPGDLRTRSSRCRTQAGAGPRPTRRSHRRPCDRRSPASAGRAAQFDPNKVPEVAAALANYQSAQAQAKLAAADSQRYANLVATGDVSRSAYEKARTQQETAEAQANAASQQYEAAANAARQSYEAVSTSQASLESVKAQLAQAEKALADTTIRAPFDGYITARPVAAGEYVALTNKIATIVRIGSAEAATADTRAARLAGASRR